VKGYASPSPPAAAENELQNRTVVTSSTKIVGFFSLNRFQKKKFIHTVLRFQKRRRRLQQQQQQQQQQITSVARSS
jgi:response regulator of citrate/malate metabolism